MMIHFLTLSRTSSRSGSGSCMICTFGGAIETSHRTPNGLPRPGIKFTGVAPLFDAGSAVKARSGQPGYLRNGPNCFFCYLSASDPDGWSKGRKWNFPRKWDGGTRIVPQVARACRTVCVSSPSTKQIESDRSFYCLPPSSSSAANGMQMSTCPPPLSRRFFADPRVEIARYLWPFSLGTVCSSNFRRNNF